ncbi:hypothetical protein MBLNU459_g6968t1 [Dothideomycetes sp. NU459]
MPGRKSNISTAANGEEGSPAAPARAGRESTGMSVEDLSLPRTMISRLAKGVLPPNTSIHKDALLALSKSATVFVNFLASKCKKIALVTNFSLFPSSNEYATLAGKKTIQPHDVIMALKDSELDAFIPKLEAELKKYNTVQCDKRNSYRRIVKEKKAAAAAGSHDDNGDASALDGSLVANGDHSTRDGDERPSKKLRREPGDEVDELAEEEEADGDGEDYADDGVENEADELGEDDDEAMEDEDDHFEDAVEEVDEEEDQVAGDGMRDEALDDGEESD